MLKASFTHLLTNQNFMLILKTTEGVLSLKDSEKDLVKIVILTGFLLPKNQFQRITVTSNPCTRVARSLVVVFP